MTSGLRIMANRSSTSATFHNGHYAFVGLYAGALPSTDLADIEAWAASYYGLTIAA